MVEASRVGALLKKYEKKNVFFFHTLGGDGELPVLHYKKHYRLHYPVIPDNLDWMRHLIRVSGISNVAVFGGDGVCVFNKGDTGQDLDDFCKVIDRALAKIKGPNAKKKAYVEGTTVYAPKVKKKDGKITHQRMSRLAAGPDGILHLVYFSDEKGSNDIYLRSCVKGTWGKDVVVAGSKADEYAPTVVGLPGGRALVAYVAMGKKCYDIFTVRVDKGKAKKPKQVTRSRDDAMGPVLARGLKGDIWLTWYEWAVMGEYSRDREVFLARAKGKGWSRKVQISPRSVPTYEDHGEPVVCSDNKGGAWVAWTWDYHGTLQSKPPVDENSIFLRHVSKKLKPGNILAPGFRGEGRARDYVPTLAVTAEGTPWIAWDNSHKSSQGYNAKAIFLNHLAGDDFREQDEVSAHKGQIDSPGLLVDPGGGLRLVWGQETRNGWELMQRSVGKEKPGKVKRIKVKSKRPRFPSACFDAQGRLWVSYTDTSSKNWKVRVVKAD